MKKGMIGGGQRVKLVKGVITKAEARKLAPDYVKWIEGKVKRGGYQWEIWDKIWVAFQRLKCGQAAITCHDGVYVKVRVTSIRSANYEADGPVVRVGNGEWTWRVDGSGYAYPVEKG